MSTKQRLDYYLSKFVSRKLMVLIISVVALFTGSITGDNFIVISTAYIGGQSVVDAVSKLRRRDE
tara:strand:- start:2285 stop:2479 length:195 start_codon:yes stop_codon:yes gene_type:complete